MHETEIKLLVSDLRAATSSILALGGALEMPRHFEDNFLFDDAAQSLRNNQTLLRVRSVQEIDEPTKQKVILTVKGKPEILEGVKKREEIECEVDPEENLIRILSRLGFQPVFRYQKYRTMYHIEGVTLHFCIDETPIGNFFELEGDMQEIHRYAEKLGFNREQYISSSYVTLYYEYCKSHGVPPSNMVFDGNPN